MWNIGNELKYIKENKTYKSLGINSFEEYCEQRLNYSKRQAYNFLTIAEKYTSEFVHSPAHLGMTKLLAIAKLDEPERETFIQITVKK